ncbi:hypothetical protein ACH5RR_013585 [Cinchona calisaya]|uniref:CRAL-TRIO domain-containing protein n=1 Tax=Cinchona calisaya TaxID=153742 RepID=A0ABD3A688_9GENT
MGPHPGLTSSIPALPLTHYFTTTTATTHHYLNSAPPPISFHPFSVVAAAVDAGITQLSSKMSLEMNRAFQLIRGRDKHNRKILRIIGKYFPGKVASVESVKQYLIENIFPELKEEAFSIVYFNADVEKSQNFAGISALKSIYDAIPIKVRDNLQAVYFVHPGIQSRLFLATFGRFIFTGGLYGKLKYISRLDYLWVHVKRMEIEIPEFVYDHDQDLEYRPMIDFDSGLEGEHPRARCALHLDSPMESYSSRCIS